jgi:hypothetical protein
VTPAARASLYAAAVDADAAQAWFTAGAIVFMAAGGGHALLTLIDTVRPIWFAPNDASVKPVMEGTGIRFRRLFPGDGERPSLWSFWLGFNVSHGLGAFAFGLLCLLIAGEDFELVERIDALEPVTIAIAAAYFAIALRYWFWVVQILTGAATLCFAVAAVVS